jgi:hypothetical protein
MLRLKVKAQEQNEQLHTQSGVDLKLVCRSLLKIIARLEGSEYTESMLRQTAEHELDDLANPASAGNTSQG